MIDSTFKHWHFKHRWPMVAEVSLFQVDQLPTNRYDYTLPGGGGGQKKPKRVKSIMIDPRVLPVDFVCNYSKSVTHPNNPD